MNTDHLIVENDPAREDVRYLAERLYDYNTEQTGVYDGQWLAIFVRDDQQTIRAGIEGWTWCGSCYINTLWGHQDGRGQGVGTKLLQAAEHEAITRGYQQIVLTSFSFQAPGFYQQHGYEVFAVLEDHPRGHCNYYLRKRLT